MHTVNFLTRIVEHHQIWAYIIIYLGLIFEGEIVVIFAGVLANLGALHFSTALVFIWAGVFTKIFALYYFGDFLYARFSSNKFFQYVEKRISTVMPRFAAKPFWSIFISTFIMGIGWIVMLFAGYKKINFKTYLKAEIASVILWAPLLLSLGYFFGEAALSVTRELWKFTLVVLLLVIGYVLFEKIAAWVYALWQHINNFAGGKKS